MNNIPPPQGNMINQPIAYSRMKNDATQLDTNIPNNIIQPPSSSNRKEIKKIKKKI